MARICPTLLTFIVTAHFASATFAAEVVTQAHSPHVPTAFWTGVVTLAGIGVVRAVRRATWHR